MEEIWINSKKKGWIESKTVNSEKGRKDSTLYSGVFSIQNLIHILEEYPALRSKMQKNDSICENVFREHLDLISNLTDIEFLNSRFGGVQVKACPVNLQEHLP